MIHPIYRAIPNCQADFQHRAKAQLGVAEITLFAYNRASTLGIFEKS